MHAQIPAMPQPGSHSSLLGSLTNPGLAVTALDDIRKQADWLCVLVGLACLVFALVEGWAYQNLYQAALWGIPLFLTGLVVTRYAAGQSWVMHVHAALLVGMGALHVHLARGLIEFHFSFFMLLPVMLAYRDARPLISMGLMIAVHHVVFDLLQQAGYECYVFSGPFSGLPAVALHGFYVAVEVAILSLIAHTLRQHAQAAAEGALLLSYLDKDRGVNLRVRAQPDEMGVVSTTGRVFNEYADNMSFIVAAFKMLRTDVRELSTIANELGVDNNQQIEDSALASKSLRDFVQNLGNQTRMGQATAEMSKKITDDCFDLLNELTQSLEHLQKISKQTFDSHQLLVGIQKEGGATLNATAAQNLASAVAMLDSLNERTQGFLSKMDVLKSGLSAIENQVVSVDRATHQWVENGHSNQRQGWEVLGAMESMQARAESALRTLNSTVQTILRSDDLMRELERRLSRFDV
ncbi:hypothetical protein [Limnobacter sp.]|uniref:hypothetical protein n=1 Tax=Limnobacter sp. TaxID=2003368 RepID=UPI003512E7BA